ncbi:MAG TPA: galactokinase [Flavitalea sp.]|nr:galactokinase [Flavitalea sp.]
MVNEIKRQFIELYGKDPIIITAPGRVNLIGEHTDYNNGFVLPGAIDKKITLAVAINEDFHINIHANQFNENYSFSPHNIGKPSGWKAYMAGVTYYYQQQTSPLRFGVDVLIDGNVPVGGGMSSSAALCSGYGMALNTLFDGGLSRVDLAYIGQKTEHNFAGVMCGIMDQFASLHGKKGNLIKLDCRSMEYEYIPFDFPDHRIVLFNSMVHHALASTEYNVRRQQCEEGVKILQQYLPGVETIRDISAEQLHQYHEALPPVVFQRCKYVIEEKDRLLEACESLKHGDLERFGQYMYATHEGLSKEYEVSCPELDFLVDQARPLPYVVGSRMMGGGFGGCTINVVEAEHVQEMIDLVQPAFNAAFGKIPEVYITNIEDGVRVEF